MGKKRSKSDIIHDMLACILEKNNRMKPTHIMYKANLSHAQLTSYLEELLNKELISAYETPKNTKYFSLTEKGSKFIEKMREMKQFEKSFGF